jgi:hypothetical protein
MVNPLTDPFNQTLNGLEAHLKEVAAGLGKTHGWELSKDAMFGIDGHVASQNPIERSRY